MTYTINKDENNYILSIAHTDKDNIELDLESMELDFLNAYQEIKGKVTLDEQRKAEIIAEREEQGAQETCRQYQTELDNTDYIMAKCVEELLECKTLIDFLKVFSDIKKQYSEKLTNRKAWRKYLEEHKK